MSMVVAWRRMEDYTYETRRSLPKHGLSGRPAGRCAVAVAAVRVRPGRPRPEIAASQRKPGETNVPPDTPRIRQRHHPTKAPLFGASLAPLLTDRRALEHRNQSIDTP